MPSPLWAANKLLQPLDSVQPAGSWGGDQVAAAVGTEASGLLSPDGPCRSIRRKHALGPPLGGACDCAAGLVCRRLFRRLGSRGLLWARSVRVLQFCLPSLAVASLRSHQEPGVRPASMTAALPSTPELLKDVHLGLPAPCQDPARLALLSGHYLYYHYGCDGLDDRGWGCGYRTLQTLCSWPEGRSSGVPGLAAVQRALEDMGDKPPGFWGSRNWIGCVEASLCLEHFGGPQGRLCHLPRGAGFREVERLYSHFTVGGGPVMVGGDADAQSKALLGICEGPGMEVYVLILDPHYWGTPKNRCELQAAGWVGWQKVNNVFDSNSFYNLCFTRHT